MKIVVVHSRYRSAAPSGENRVVDTETRALRDAGHTVVPFERMSDDIESWSLRRRAALPATVVWNRSARQELTALLRDVRPDVVHVHNTFPLLTSAVLQAPAEASVPLVVTLHNYKLACASGDFFRAGAPCHACSGKAGGPAVAHGCYRGSTAMTVPVVVGTMLGRSLWRTSPAAYIFISDAQRRALADLRLPEVRSFVKWNLVPRRPEARRVDEALVAYAGRLDEVKGVPLLLEAWERFSATAEPGSLRLAIAGGGPLESQVRAWSAERSDVDYLGLLSREACGELLSRSRATLVPSAWEETFGLIAVEAMASGVPVIGPAHGSLPELVSDGVNGALYSPGDASDLTRLLHDVAGDPRRWAQLGSAARRSYEENFDPDVNLEQLLRIYRFAIQNPVTAGAGRPAIPAVS